MPFSQADKLAVLDGLTASRRQGQLAEVSLRLGNQAGEADRIRAKTEELTDEIDDLMAAMMKDWLGQAAECVPRITACTTGLETAVADIKRKVQIAQNVVKAIGFIDDAVAIAKKVLAA